MLIWWGIFFILYLSFEVLNSVCWLNFKANGFTGEGFLDILDSNSS